MVFAYKYTMSACLKVSDEDAADFLQSQFSNDLRPFASNQCTYGLWLDTKGKVSADSYVLCEGEEDFLLLSEHSSGEFIREKLERHIIADDVELTEVEGGAVGLSLIGASAEAWIRSQGFEIPEVGSFYEKDGLYLFSGRRSAQPNFELVATSPESIQRLEALASDSELEAVSKDWIQSQRIAARIPSIPFEVGPADLPGEGGLVSNAVSLTKGCFLGQEVVARMHNVGRPQRALYLVTGEGTQPQVPQPLRNAAGKSVGELRTAFITEAAWRGVALLKIRYASLDEGFFLEDGAEVKCTAPFYESGGTVES